MHEDVFAGLRGDEAIALLVVEPFHSSNRHVLVPPSTVLEVSTNAGPFLAPTARDKLDLRVAKQNVNLCQATVAGTVTTRHQPGHEASHRPAARRAPGARARWCSPLP